MEKSETQENTTMTNKKRNNNATTTLSSSPTPNSSQTKPNTEDEEPKAKIQRECYTMRSRNYKLKITFAKPPPSQQQPSLGSNNNNKQGEASKMKMKMKKAASKSAKLSFVDHDNDAVKASIVEHVTRNLGLNKEDISKLKVIMEKKMTPTDMAPQQARLALPAGSAEKLDASFLTNDEKEFLKVADINVNVIMGSSVYEMPLGRWNNFVDKKNNIDNNKDPGFKYVLKSGKRRQWPKLKEENGLQTDDNILVATFRYNNALHFVIIKGKPVMLFGTAIAHKYT